MVGYGSHSDLNVLVRDCICLLDGNGWKRWMVSSGSPVTAVVCLPIFNDKRYENVKIIIIIIFFCFLFCFILLLLLLLLLMKMLEWRYREDQCRCSLHCHVVGKQFSSIDSSLQCWWATSYWSSTDQAQYASQYVQPATWSPCTVGIIRQLSGQDVTAASDTEQQFVDGCWKCWYWHLGVDHHHRSTQLLTCH